MGREEGEVVGIFLGGLLRPSSSIAHLRRIPFLPRQSEAVKKSKFRKAVTSLLLAAPHPMYSDVPIYNCLFFLRMLCQDFIAIWPRE